MKEISESEIRSRLTVSYATPGSTAHRFERALVKTEVVNSYQKVGTILYSLAGSPPKGYCLYVPEHRILVFLDGHGDRKSKVTDVEVVE